MLSSFWRESTRFNPSSCRHFISSKSIIGLSPLRRLGNHTHHSHESVYGHGRLFHPGAAVKSTLGAGIIVADKHCNSRQRYLVKVLDRGKTFLEGNEGALGDRRLILAGLPADGINRSAFGAFWELDRELHRY
jgi:hypothetical protein